MSSCCTSDTDSQPCPSCGHIGPIVGAAPVRPHRTEAADGAWQHCANTQCEVVYHLAETTVVAAELIAQVGVKATGKTTPVCFCFAHTTESLAADLEANDGVSTIQLSVKTAVAEGFCACKHLNPSGLCCLPDIHRTLKAIKIGDVAVSSENLFKSAGPFQNDVLALPVADIDEAASYYSRSFGMSEVSRAESPKPQVVLERDGVQLGFEVNGGDSSRPGPSGTGGQRRSHRQLADRRARWRDVPSVLCSCPRRPLLLLPPADPVVHLKLAEPGK